MTVACQADDPEYDARGGLRTPRLCVACQDQDRDLRVERGSVCVRHGVLRRTAAFSDR
jgi:hypothetical protein